MDYMILIYRDEADAPEPGSPEHGQMLAGWLAFNQRLIDGGHWITGGALALSDTATTVRLDGNGSAPGTVTDGPYAETKEQLGGYYLISAPDLDVALELARALPIRDASVEVRPVASRPDAG
ncbi:YciI family protein [Nakamurella leprariae]|uniref:YCII-related domain-containing protein n=1 Tax=Nakamurella leprariae TaxID=2803911 RepID=A0A938YJV7_9ACTN|nr:YciI family protein [Nakamurella leprariae]MBM9469499.1 hypothetical protein [Nakamurella leprariae]